MLSSASRRHRPWRVAEIGPAAVNGLVQRVPAGAGQVRIGALVEQEARHFPVRVGGRHDERALAIGQQVVDVRSRLEQGARAVDVAGADREEECGEPGGRRAGEDPDLGVRGRS